MARAPTLDEMVRLGVNRVLEGVNTVHPAKVISYNSEFQRIVAKPDVKKRIGGRFIELPRLVNVPVVFPSGGGFSFTFPLDQDDEVVLVFSQVSLDEYLEGAGNVEPADFRRFNLSDAFAFPGPAKFNQKITIADAANLVLGNTNGQIHIEKNGDIKLHSKSASEPFVLGNKLKTWAASVDAALALLGAWSQTGVAPGPAGGIAPLIPKPTDPQFPTDGLSSTITGE